MAEFYSARGWEIPPLPWTNLSPPFSHGRTDHRDSGGAGARHEDGGGCRNHGISPNTFYKWKAKYGGLDISDARKLKSLETENGRLKRLLADTMLDNVVLKDLLGKN